MGLCCMIVRTRRCSSLLASQFAATSAPSTSHSFHVSYFIQGEISWALCLPFPESFRSHCPHSQTSVTLAPAWKYISTILLSRFSISYRQESSIG
mmetsp:Transcript_29405/g.75807  ORF Transcript_29405/g.75807 Transcript_29405/m.75807 type:complete len:95 (-) Transcript_29405:1926-2210(-)